MMRIYNDTNLIGENAEQEPDEYLALNQLRELTDSDGSKLIIETISNRTLNELEKTKDALQRRRLQKATDELPKETHDRTVLGFQTLSDRYGTSFSGPLIADVPNQEIYEKLMALPLKDAMDARHLTHNKYDVFLTRDRKTILKKRKEIEALFPVTKLMKPSELLSHFKKTVWNEAE
jgi:hypothetical protein